MVVQSGSCKDECMVISTIETIADQIMTSAIQSPEVIVIGQMVALHTFYTLLSEDGDDLTKVRSKI